MIPALQFLISQACFESADELVSLCGLRTTLPDAFECVVPGRAQSGATTKYEFAYAMRIATDEEATAPLSRVFIQTAPYDRPHNELRTDDPLWWPPILC
jgi:hypothetical protein